jgi:hypothetical protein
MLAAAAALLAIPFLGRRESPAARAVSGYPTVANEP